VINVEGRQVMTVPGTELAVFLEHRLLREPAVLEQIGDMVAVALGDSGIRPLDLLVVGRGDRALRTGSLSGV
jgi:hypothetical protein